MSNVLALDIGGSSVKSATVDLERKRVEGEIITTRLADNQFETLRAIVIGIVEKHGRRHDRSLVGISTSGSVGLDGTVVSAGHFEGYAGVNWSDVLNRQLPTLDIRSVTANDGRAAAWGEYEVTPNGINTLIHVVVGTGVGGGVVHQGVLLQGDSGQAGYLGHIKIVEGETPLCSCRQTGCVETLASAPAIVRFYDHRLAALGNDTTATKFDFDYVAAQMLSGDSNAADAFQTAGRYLGIGLGNAMNVLNPTLVTIGGGVMLASLEADPTGKDDPPGGPIIKGVLEGARYACHRRVFASADIRQGSLGNDAGLIGAALLVGSKSAA